MMKMIIAVLFVTFPALAQTSPPPDAPPTDRERIKSERAKAAAHEKSAPTARAWDKGADGKRPWDRKAP